MNDSTTSFDTSSRLAAAEQNSGAPLKHRCTQTPRRKEIIILPLAPARAMLWTKVHPNPRERPICDFGQPAASPDGSKVAVAIYDKEWWTPDLWVLDLARGTKTRLTFGPGTAFNPVWEPDGQALIFGSVQNGQKHIFRKSLTGRGFPRLFCKRRA